MKPNIKLNQYILSFFIIVFIVIIIGDSIKFNSYKQTLIENFQNQQLNKTQQIREDYRLLFDKLQYNFRKVEAQNIKKLNQLFEIYKKDTNNFDMRKTVEILNKDVAFGSYQIFFINKKYIIEKASYKNDIGYNLGQYKVVSDLFDKIFDKKIPIDISAPKFNNISADFKRYLIRVSDDGKYILQIGFVFDTKKILKEKYNLSKTDTDNLDIYFANEYFIQKIEFDKRNVTKKDLDYDWNQTKDVLKELLKYSNINKQKYNKLLKLLNSNQKDTKVVINKEIDNLFKNDKLIKYLDLKDNKLFVYSITDGLFNNTNETKLIIKSVYSTKQLENNIKDIYNQMILQLSIIFLILTIIYIFIYNSISNKLLSIINTIQNNEISNIKNIKVKEIQILNDRYNELHNKLNKELYLNTNLLYENKRFIADTVHQIRTPLTNIMMNSEMIKRNQKDNTLSDFVDQINASINMLTNSYEDLSYITSYDTIEYNPTNVCLSEILSQRVKFFKTISKVNFKEIVTNIQSDINFTINQIELERIIDNNISNGIKYADTHKPITINLTKENDTVVLSFYTYGKPIKNPKKIFNKNHREDESKRGLGLGLNMVKGICEKYGITYDVTYEDNQNIFRYRFK